MPRYYQLVENLHKNGATVAIRINHAELLFFLQEPEWKLVSSSNIPTKVGGEVLSDDSEEILTTVKYGEAAACPGDWFPDAIEIHCGHSYLMSQFISLTIIREQTSSEDSENCLRFYVWY